MNNMCRFEHRSDDASVKKDKQKEHQLVAAATAACSHTRTTSTFTRVVDMVQVTGRHWVPIEAHYGISKVGTFVGFYPGFPGTTGN